MNYSKAKDIYFSYNGSSFHMDRDGVLQEFTSYHVPKVLIEEWQKELCANYEKIIMQTKDAAALTDAVFKYSDLQFVPANARASFLWKFLNDNIHALDDFSLLLFYETFLSPFFEVWARMHGVHGFLETQLRVLLKKSEFYVHASYKQLPYMDEEYFARETICDRIEGDLASIVRMRTPVKKKESFFSRLFKRKNNEIK